jgi:hypothetical protein
VRGKSTPNGRADGVSGADRRQSLAMRWGGTSVAAGIFSCGNAKLGRAACTDDNRRAYRHLSRSLLRRLSALIWLSQDGASEQARIWPVAVGEFGGARKDDTATARDEPGCALMTCVYFARL